MLPGTQAVCPRTGAKHEPEPLKTILEATKGDSGTDITNRGSTGRVQTNCGMCTVATVGRHREAPTERCPALFCRRSSGELQGWRETLLWSIRVFHADSDPCKACNATIVSKGEEERLCNACHRPSRDWTHFSLTYLPRVTQILVNAREAWRRSSAQCSVGGFCTLNRFPCTRLDCIAHLAGMAETASQRSHVICYV